MDSFDGMKAQKTAIEAREIPVEILDLVRFLANTWTEIDAFVYEHCDGEALMKYPVIQGTRNQINLKKIGEQSYNLKKIREAVEWMLSSK